MFFLKIERILAVCCSFLLLSTPLQAHPIKANALSNTDGQLAFYSSDKKDNIQILPVQAIFNFGVQSMHIEEGDIYEEYTMIALWDDTVWLFHNQETVDRSFVNIELDQSIQVYKSPSKQWALEFYDKYSQSRVGIVFESIDPEGLFQQINLDSNILDRFKSFVIRDIKPYIRENLDGIMITLNDKSQWIVTEDELSSLGYDPQVGDYGILGISKNGLENFWVIVPRFLSGWAEVFYFDVKEKSSKNTHYSAEAWYRLNEY